MATEEYSVYMMERKDSPMVEAKHAKVEAESPEDALTLAAKALHERGEDVKRFNYAVVGKRWTTWNADLAGTFFGKDDAGELEVRKEAIVKLEEIKDGKPTTYGI